MLFNLHNPQKSLFSSYYKFSNNMKLFAFSALVALSAFGSVQADGPKIVAAARTQMNVPYSWGGGGWNGKSLGEDQGAHTVGFDCSGLAQYAVYQGTGKKITRNSKDQFNDPQCHHVPYDQHQPGDLVFFEAGGIIHHVAIISGHNMMIHAPHTGDHVREATVYNEGRVSKLQRCF